MRHLIGLAATCCLGVVACSGGSNTTSDRGELANGAGSNGDAAVPDDSSPGASTALKCADIFVCASECPDGDDACSERCVERGTTSGTRTATALAICFDQGDCTDEACLRDKCGDELAACLEDGTDEGATATEQAPAKGTVPPALVGTWFTSTSTTVMQFIFAADGTATMKMDYATQTGCKSTISTTSNGIVVADATTIVIHREGGTQTSAICGGSSSQKPIPPATLRYTYTLDTSGDVPFLNLLTSDGLTYTLRRS